ncbi:MAG TPA: LamG domain-containing protein [Lacipirellula sp.]
MAFSILHARGLIRFVLPLACLHLAALAHSAATAEQFKVIALWLFDEQQGIYPSCVLGDAGSNRFPLVLGPGGRIVEGKFGNALEPSEPPKVRYPLEELLVGLAEKQSMAVNRSGAAPAITWQNNQFCALMTRGERHLRQEVNFGSPTNSSLNLAQQNWTIEFWFRLRGDSAEGESVVFEIGEGPRGANDRVTQLLLAEDGLTFVLVNQPSGTRLAIASAPAEKGQWRHYAFVFDGDEGQLRHYVDGRLQPLPEKCRFAPLNVGDEDYMSVGRDCYWRRSLPGALDEMRFSQGEVYTADFSPPSSFSKYHHGYEPPSLKAGPPLLFAGEADDASAVPLGDRKHVFIDNALLSESENITFQANPPRLAELVLENKGFSNHVSVFENEASGDGLVRLYFRGPDNSLAVWESDDGVHFRAPDLGREYQGRRNIVIEDPVGLGSLFVDPNAPPEERIKYYSGYRGRGQFVYSSPDGYTFTRNETAALPFRGASQSLVYYDDQRQTYVGYHRSDMYRTSGGKTERSAVMTETRDLMRPWPFRPVSQEHQNELGKRLRLGRKSPYYVDNGPVTPPGFGLEYPRVFAPESEFDEPGVDIYVPKCMKYPWATDTYVAFPLMYFHYDGEGPEGRVVLGREERQRGSGPIETQLAVSRDGISWRRYPRPAYIGIGHHAGLDLKKNYIAHGMVRRGDEIWQYYAGSDRYHSTWQESGREAIFRVVQRLDGFVSADFSYTGGHMVTRPLTFTGNGLILNVDADATGHLQVGLLNEVGEFIEGFGVEDCVYVNCDETAAEVEWLDNGKDLSSLAGRVVRVRIEGRGAKLYSMQFVER